MNKRLGTELLALDPLYIANCSYKDLWAVRQVAPTCTARDGRPARGLRIVDSYWTGTAATAYLRAGTTASLLVHRNTIRCRLTGFAALSGLNVDHTSEFILAWWLLN